ncbi:MAG: hypothetical protein AAB681_00005 [Patescibacteria group bacterium]
MNNPSTIYAIGTTIFGLVMLLLWVRSNRKAEKWEMSCYQLRLAEFKRKAKEVKTLAEGMLIIEQYKNAVSVKFSATSAITPVISEALIKRITSTSEPDMISRVLGDLSMLKDKDSGEGRLWHKIKPEVLSHLKNVYHQHNDGAWLRPLVG